MPKSGLIWFNERDPTYFNIVSKVNHWFTNTLKNLLSFQRNCCSSGW